MPNIGHRHLTFPESGLRDMPERDSVLIMSTYISALVIPKCLLGLGLERVRYGSPGLDKLQKRGSSRRVGDFFAARHREIHVGDKGRNLHCGCEKRERVLCAG